jgi:uncharacterized membrane protein (UPF0182 family)
MAKIIKEVLKFAIVVMVVVLGTISVHVSNQREYMRSENGDVVAYPQDINLNALERNAAGLGTLVSVILMIAIVYFFSQGAIFIFKKYSEKFGIGEINMLILSIWIFCIGVYALVTSQFGMAFILDPFFGKKIYYGGYDRIIYKLNERTSKITNDNYLSEEEKRKLLQELKHRIEQIQDDKYQEIQHIEYMKNSK